jgi:iron complex outermembrane recepter protein
MKRIASLVSTTAGTIVSAVCTTLLLASALSGKEVETRGVSYELNIPSENLAVALQALAFASHHRLLYRANIVSGKTSSALIGTFTIDKAVSQLLSGTDLTFEITSASVVLIEERKADKSGAASSGEAPLPSGSPRGPVLLAQAKDAEIVDGSQPSGVPGLPSETNTSEDKLEEIVVTSEHRAQNIQDVPATVTAMTGGFLDNHLITSTFDIVSHVPNLTYTAFSRAQGAPTFRGSTQSQDDAPGIDAPVAIFIDDVYQGRILNWDIAAFDVDRIEILHGPQGTLFGRNVVGGAIDIITRKPADSFEAEVSVSTGNYNDLRMEGFLSGPVAENLTARLSVFSEDRDGYTRNAVNGQKLDALNVKGARAQLQYERSDDFKYLLSASMTKDDSYGQSRGYVGAKPEAPSLAGVVNNNSASTSQDAFDGGVNITTSNVTGTGNWKLPFADLVSISAYSATEFNQPTSDIAGAPIPIFTQAINENVRQFSQEIRFLSPSTFDYLKWVGGLYFINIKDLRYFTQTTYLEPDTYLGDIQNAIFGNTNPQSFNDRMYIDSRSYAAYGQIVYSPVRRMNLTLGGRYTYDLKSGNIAGAGDSFLLLPSGPFAVAVSHHWDAFTPKATIDYHVNDDFMFYATYAKGYKSGGYTDHGRNFVKDFTVPLNPEHAESYELGIKSEWLDHHLIANITGYHVKYSQLQEAEYEADGTFLIANGDAVANGADLELTAKPFAGLETYLDYSYFTGHFTNFGVDTGNQLGSPKDALTAGFDYRWPIVGGNAILVNSDVQRKSRYFFNADNDPALTTKYNAIVDARISFESKSGWTASLWGKNLTNERALAFGNDFSAFFLSTSQVASGLSAVSTTYIPPLTWGLSFDYKYGHR